MTFRGCMGSSGGPIFGRGFRRGNARRGGPAAAAAAPFRDAPGGFWSSGPAVGLSLVGMLGSTAGAVAAKSVVRGSSSRASVTSCTFSDGGEGLGGIAGSGASATSGDTTGSSSVVPSAVPSLSGSGTASFDIDFFFFSMKRLAFGFLSFVTVSPPTLLDFFFLVSFALRPRRALDVLPPMSADSRPTFGDAATGDSGSGVGSATRSGSGTSMIASTICCGRVVVASAREASSSAAVFASAARASASALALACAVASACSFTYLSKASSSLPANLARFDHPPLPLVCPWASIC
mmetsp:Transcript_27512/g.72326  ORF Transcript_27512/g.72326 Transcript_27512/m.72326 type:complete len:293 (-) Transcript_27512:2187-3065(-)